MKRTARRATPLKRLRGLRAEQGLSQIEMARRLGVSQSTYCLIERGLRPASDDEQDVVARVLRVEKAELFPTEEVA